MSSTLGTARQALANYLDGIDGMVAFSYIPDAVPAPAIVIVPGDADYLQTMRSTDTEYALRAQIVVGRVNDQQAQELLDELVSADGAKSVAAFVESDPTLGGAVDYCKATSMSDYGRGQVNNVEMMVATVNFEVRV